MSQEVIFLILCLLIFFIFVGVLVYWLYVSSRPFNQDQTSKGTYPDAGLNQRCSTGITGANNITLLLPGYYEPQGCGYNLTCVPNGPGDIYGICKSIVSGACNTVYDCAPSNLGQVYCSGGVCNLGLTGGLNSACNSNAQCDISKGLVCAANGACLYFDGEDCTNNNQCAGGLCNFTSPGVGTCTSKYPGGGVCLADYCETGFSCVDGICQPVGPTGATLTPGDRGTFCSIPYYSNPSPLDQLVCNSGLICNFIPQTFNTTKYPGITGLGLCDIPFTPQTVSCNSISGACIPPSVCNNLVGVTGGYCSAPIVGGEFNINWCGIGSSSICESGYTCDPTTFQCLPSIGSMCNGVTGICTSGACTSYNVGVFSPSRNLSIAHGATGAFGTWTYISLPSSVTPNSSTRISTYQVNTIGSAPYYAPITKTRFIYCDASLNSSNTFYYSEINIDDEGVVTQDSMGWKLINLSVAYTAFEGLKFTSGGSISFAYYDTSLNDFHIDYVPYSNLDLNTDTLDVITGAVDYYAGTLYTNWDWDIDDVYNMGVVVLDITTSTFYNTPISSPGVMANIGTLPTAFTTPPSWVKYTVSPTNTSYSSNILTNGILTGDTEQTIYKLEYTTGFTSSIAYLLTQNVNNGVGASFNITNNINEAEFYYVSDTEFLYSTYVASININNEPLQVSLVGYPPDFMVTGRTNGLSCGNLDARLYTIVSICE